MTKAKPDVSASDMPAPDQQTDENPRPSHIALSWRHTLLSGLSAAMGIQSNANRQRDFDQGSVTRFLIAGVMLTGLFASALLLVISLLLP